MIDQISGGSGGIRKKGGKGGSKKKTDGKNEQNRETQAHTHNPPCMSSTQPIPSLTLDAGLESGRLPQGVFGGGGGGGLAVVCYVI